LIIKEKSPNVIIVRGKVRIINSGLIEILMRPKRPAAMITVGNESALIPGISIVESKMANVMMSQRIIITIMGIP
jgi:hypothetical protein